MKKRIRLLLVSSLSLLYFSCYYDQEIVLPEVEVPDNVTISFQADIEPLFSQSGKDCTQCHNGTQVALDLRPGNAFAQIFPLVIPEDAEGSVFYQRLPGVGHPFNVGFTLDGTEIALIKAWIDRGAENN